MPRKFFSNVYWSMGKSLYELDVRRRRTNINAAVKEADIGVKIKYLEVGEPRDNTVVIFHGFSDSKDGFLHIAQRLMKDYHLIIPDMPGFGENEQHDDFRYDIDQYSKWMERFVDEVVGRSYHLIGHSMGGAIATQMCSDRAEHVRSLTIMCGGGVITLPLVGFYKDLADGYNLFSIENKKDFREFLSTNFHKKPFMPGSVKHFVYKRYAENREWYNKIMYDLIGDMDADLQEIPQTVLNHRLKEISVPTLILWGEYDGLFPHDIIGQEYHKNIKNSQLRVIEKAGHCLNLECPGKVSAIFKEFVCSLDGTQSV
ncbi:alpha/beta fold hydrolase [Candidatus Uabimicrobium amorphum]|uniref:Lipase n=1 Tax=Uabimicrobium amorphum TaxID=2596890 RepID=A0A5S9ITG7_UABAM|nr:alpha/beta hydrolase [Candidatus Uabimicrobium amorphum]BBM87316.1 lipase [Candidatus Uabimicrobium amorphum]